MISVKLVYVGQVSVIQLSSNTSNNKDINTIIDNIN